MGSGQAGGVIHCGHCLLHFLIMRCSHCSLTLDIGVVVEPCRRGRHWIIGSLCRAVCFPREGGSWVRGASWIYGSSSDSVEESRALPQHSGSGSGPPMSSSSVPHVNRRQGRRGGLSSVWSELQCALWVVETDDEVLEGSGSGRAAVAGWTVDDVIEGVGSGSAENVTNTA